MATTSVCLYIVLLKLISTDKVAVISSSMRNALKIVKSVQCYTWSVQISMISIQVIFANRLEMSKKQRGVGFGSKLGWYIVLAKVKEFLMHWLE